MHQIPVRLACEWVDRYATYLPKAQEFLATPANEPTDFGVERSTIRAISNGGSGSGGPLQCFNDWAGNAAFRIRKDAAQGVVPQSRDEFDALHSKLTTSLCSHWDAKAPTNPLSIAHRYKLVDLFVRWVAIKGWQPVNGPQGEALRVACRNFGHIPLDRKSLHILSETFGGIGLSGPFSMGNIHTQQAYDFYQDLARCVVSQAGGSALLFDTFCWHHPDCQAVYNKATPTP